MKCRNPRPRASRYPWRFAPIRASGFSASNWQVCSPRSGNLMNSWSATTAPWTRRCRCCGASRLPHRFRWRCTPIPVTLGVTENFGQAIARCQGELIALCDQDDVWKPEKLARVAECFADDPSLDALFSDAELIDAEGRSLGQRLWQEIAFNAREQALVETGRAIEVLADRFLATGAALVFRRRLLPDILPMPAVRPRELLHDGWIALIAAATGKLRALTGAVDRLSSARRTAGWLAGSRQLAHQIAGGARRAPREFCRSLAGKTGRARGDRAVAVRTTWTRTRALGAFRAKDRSSPPPAGITQRPDASDRTRL